MEASGVAGATILRRSPAAKTTVVPPVVVRVTTPEVLMLIVPTVVPFFVTDKANVAAGLLPTFTTEPARLAARVKASVAGWSKSTSLALGEVVANAPTR